MTNNAATWIVTLLFLAVVGLSVLWTVTSWIECREQFSFWTCLRMLAK